MAGHPSSSAYPNVPSKFSLSMENQPPNSHTLPNTLEENLPNNPNILPRNYPNAFSDPFANSRLIDPSSPHFLHNGDNLGTILVPQPLTGENYNPWSQSMLIALSAKNKVYFVDGSLPKPLVFESYSNTWVR